MIRVRHILLLTVVMLLPLSVAYSSDLGTADETITAFFKKLETGAIEDGYKTLFEGSLISKEKPQAIQAMVTQTSAAFAIYGKILGWERVEEKVFGQSLKKITYLMNTKYPVAWEFYFWKSEGRWSVVNVRFVEQVQEVFY